MRKYTEEEIRKSPCIEVAGYRYEHNEMIDTLKDKNKEAFALLKEIENKIKNNAKGNVNWGHVGNMEYVLKELKNINSFLK
jgi:predicted phage-related endonuclease